jgi:hypothetical protein
LHHDVWARFASGERGFETTVTGITPVPSVLLSVPCLLGVFGIVGYLKKRQFLA